MSEHEDNLRNVARRIEDHKPQQFNWQEAEELRAAAAAIRAACKKPVTLEEAREAGKRRDWDVVEQFLNQQQRATK